MNLLVTFVISATIALGGIAWLSVIIDKFTSSFTSLLIFFPLFFATIYVAWKLSVKFTEPKGA